MIITKWSLQILAYTQLRLHNMNICFDNLFRISLAFPLNGMNAVTKSCKTRNVYQNLWEKGPSKGTVSHTVILTRRVNHLGWNLTQAPRGGVEKYKLQMKMGAGPACWTGKQQKFRRSPPLSFSSILRVKSQGSSQKALLWRNRGLMNK